VQLERKEGIVNEKPHATLLRHIAEVWVKGETFHSTDDLISMLVARFPSSWGASDKYPKGLTAQRLGRMLVKNYGVYSDPTASKIRGYSAKSFDRALQLLTGQPIGRQRRHPVRQLRHPQLLQLAPQRDPRTRRLTRQPITQQHPLSKRRNGFAHISSVTMVT
jgi:hypothetical protein